MTAILTHLDQEHLASGCWTGAKLPFIVPNIAIMWGWVFFLHFLAVFGVITNYGTVPLLGT